ncbi:cupin domain-containing protein [Microbulbifer sp. OS29]|uniref:Cupin domain-containing protein n=1 Tax=Microbulbifer okhotskensis TaxID=2926617 RepID=A0A9X2ENE6_9GAMM|nr:cupin domain-containing protein [Microbulbifer okhotskensis]MCO1332798.1 cupin domain-containing protein [Microbulbifer okhotskensis]
MNHRLLFLPVLVITFFSTALFGQEKTNDVSFETLVSSTKDWEGHVLPKMKPGQPELTVVSVTIPAGKQMPVHKHPVLNGVYVAEGTLTIVLPGQKETLTLGEGKAFIEVTDKWHYGRNDGETPVTIILFYSGLEGQPTTIYKNPDDALN